MRRWADDLLVPKVLVANQTRVDRGGRRPRRRVAARRARPDRPAGATPATSWPVAAVLTSPVASAGRGTAPPAPGLSAGTPAARPALAGRAAVAGGPVGAGGRGAAGRRRRGCGRAVVAAYGLDGDRRAPRCGVVGAATCPGVTSAARTDPLPDCTPDDDPPPERCRSARSASWRPSLLASPCGGAAATTTAAAAATADRRGRARAGSWPPVAAAPAATVPTARAASARRGSACSAARSSSTTARRWSPTRPT